MKILLHLVSLALVCSLGACAVDPVLRTGYPEYLENHAGKSQLPSTDKVNQYYLPPRTEFFTYYFRTGMAVTLTGGIPTFVVEIGKMLDDTLKSTDVQAAFGTLKTVDSASVSGTTLVFDLQNYEFKDFGAHISLNIKLMKDETVFFEKNYVQSGETQGTKMLWGGILAVKNAVQQSTKQALDEILRQLITDLNELQ